MHAHDAHRLKYILLAFQTIYTNNTANIILIEREQVQNDDRDPFCILYVYDVTCLTEIPEKKSRFESTYHSKLHYTI